MARAIGGICIVLTAFLISNSLSRADEVDGTMCGVVSVAHRGGISPDVPENTLAAFTEAIGHGVNAIEIDLRGTKDGEIVVIHDSTVNRTTNGRGRVSKHTLAELKQLDAGRGQRIPTYEETLQLVAGTEITLLLDIKKSASLDKSRVIRLTEQYNAVANVIVGTRDLEDLQAFQKLNSKVRTLGFVWSVRDIEPFVNMGVDIVRMWPKWIYADPESIEKLHKLGTPVWTTAGDAPRDELKKLIKLGVDGIITDSPRLLKPLPSDASKWNCE